MITETDKNMELIVVYYDFTSYVTPFLVKFFYSLFIICYILQLYHWKHKKLQK
jgi:hypothetical protein